MLVVVALCQGYSNGHIRLVWPWVERRYLIRVLTRVAATYLEGNCGK